MIEVSMSLPEASAATFLAKFAAWPVKAWRNRQARASIAGMSEREFQDIGWGQTDRWATELNYVEPPEDGRARKLAREAWLARTQKAA